MSFKSYISFYTFLMKDKTRKLDCAPSSRVRLYMWSKVSCKV